MPLVAPQVRVSGHGGWFLLRLSLHDPVLPLNIEASARDTLVTRQRRRHAAVATASSEALIPSRSRVST